MSNFSGGALITGISNSLLNTYGQIASVSGNKGVTQSTIGEAMSNKDISGSLNQTFASYLQSNFSQMDKNHDGKITSDEINQVSNLINTQGLTSAQLTQLGTSCGLSQEALSQVLAHFADIDKNHDGKVTTAEINAYNVEASKMKIADEMRLKSATNMSMFYGSESSSDNTPKSIMSFKYLD